jgi:hypothetical protein
MTRLPVRATLLSVALCATILLAGCGDDDTVPTEAIPRVPSATQAADDEGSATSDFLTVTADANSGGAMGDASPSSVDTTDATVIAATATSEEPSVPTMTATPETANATATLDADDVSTPAPTESPESEEQTLISILFGPEDLPEGWVLDGDAGPVEPEDDDGEELCATGGFPNEAQSLGQVAAQYLNEDTETVMLQKVWAYPGDVASEAFSFWRESSSCESWDEDERTRVTISSLEDPGFADESFAVHVAFESIEDDSMRIAGDYVFIRSGTLLMLIAYLGSDDADFAPLADPIEAAVERLQEASATFADE